VRQQQWRRQLSLLRLVLLLLVLLLVLLLLLLGDVLLLLLLLLQVVVHLVLLRLLHVCNRFIRRHGPLLASVRWLVGYLISGTCSGTRCCCCSWGLPSQQF
jgi:small-conductance mechanosensitive channel